MKEKSLSIYLIGIGMGTEAMLTVEAREVLKDAKIVIGAKRMVESFENTSVWQERKANHTLPMIYEQYKPVDIERYVSEQKEIVLRDFDSMLSSVKIAVLLSGDVGFCSGAKKLLEVFHNYKVHMIPGITTVSYLASKVHLSWEDMKLCTLHGTELDQTNVYVKNSSKISSIINTVHHNRYTFTLLGGEESVNSLCRLLLAFHMKTVKLYVGECLSYPEEKIHTIYPELGYVGQQPQLTAVIMENPYYVKAIDDSFEEEEFMRGKVPMTKSEVREVSIRKLKLTKDAICYDIGAGTGSIGIEIAAKSPSTTVYAIEKNPEAVDLIEQNKKKFCVDNLAVIEGVAPEALANLPAPTHVFLGGTTGNLESIMKVVWEKNPQARVVLNAIALETVAQAVAFEKKYDMIDSEVVQLQVSKSRKLGSYHMMTGQNPIYVITWQRTVKEGE